MPRRPIENAGSDHIARVPFEDFAGERIACAYNLNQCGPGKPDKPGEACWTVRAKASASSTVLGYVPYVLLKDCEFVISPTRLKAVQERGSKEVFAWVVGTAVAQKGARVPAAWSSVGFSPLLPPKGRGEGSFKLVDEDGRRASIKTLPWFFGKGRKALGSAGVRNNPADGEPIITLGIGLDAPDFMD